MGLHARWPLPHHPSSTRTGATSSTTWVWATCGTSLLGSRTPSRDWRRVASSCSSSTTATSQRMRPSCLTDWFKHTARSVLAKNFGLPVSAFDNLPTEPDHQRYMFAGKVPPPLAQDAVRSPAGHRAEVDQPSHAGTEADEGRRGAGAHHRLVQLSRGHHHRGGAGGDRARGDARAALAPNADEWQYYLGGLRADDRLRLEQQGAYLRLPGGGCGLCALRHGAYVENTGDETLTFLEMFRSNRFADVSLAQWLALSPPELVQAHLNVYRKR